MSSRRLSFQVSAHPAVSRWCLRQKADATYADLQNAVDTLRTYAARLPMVSGLSTSMQADIPQLYFDVWTVTGAQMLGIPVSDIFSTMKAFTGSIYVNDFNMFNRIYRVYIFRLTHLTGCIATI